RRGAAAGGVHPVAPHAAVHRRGARVGARAGARALSVAADLPGRTAQERAGSVDALAGRRLAPGPLVAAHALAAARDALAAVAHLAFGAAHARAGVGDARAALAALAGGARHVGAARLARAVAARLVVRAPGREATILAALAGGAVADLAGPAAEAAAAV